MDNVPFSSKTVSIDLLITSQLLSPSARLDTFYCNFHRVFSYCKNCNKLFSHMNSFVTNNQPTVTTRTFSANNTHYLNINSKYLEKQQQKIKAI